MLPYKNGQHCLFSKGYLQIDLFGQIPDKVSLRQKIWSLRPNAVLMNMGFSNYRLIHIAGGYLLNYQTAPVLYYRITGRMEEVSQIPGREWMMFWQLCKRGQDLPGLPS